MTEKHRQIRDIHIKQEQKKAPTCCYFLTEGTGSDCQTIDAQLVRGCAAPYVLKEDKLPVKMQCNNKYGHSEESL